MGTLLLFIEIKTTKGKYCEQFFANKLDNSDETHKFLERQKPPKLTQETESLNSPITNKEIKLVIIKFPKKKSQAQIILLVKSTNH